MKKISMIDALIGDDERLRADVEVAAQNAHIAQMVYAARTDAGLTQAQLAALIGTKQSAISRLEDGDYEGHSLMILRKVAKALGKNLIVDWGEKFSGRAKRIVAAS